MSGLPITSKSDWKRVQEEYRSGRPPADDPDAPDFAPLMRAEVARLKRGRLPGSGVKASQTVRFDIAVLEAFKATGKGWQTRMNDALKTYLKEHPLKPA